MFFQPHTQYSDHHGARVIWPESPCIHLFERFIDADLARHIIELARLDLRPGGVVTKEGFYVTEPANRNNRLSWLTHQTSSRIEQLCLDVANIVGMPLSHAEPIQVVNYRVGEYYRAHLDSHPVRLLKAQTGGQRLVTALIYLNDVDAGGETAFPALRYRQKPRLGDMLIFHNTRPGSIEPEPRSKHAALPVTRGEKWAMNLWFRQSAYVRT